MRALYGEVYIGQKIILFFFVKLTIGARAKLNCGLRAFQFPAHAASLAEGVHSGGRSRLLAKTAFYAQTMLPVSFMPEQNDCSKSRFVLKVMPA